MTTNDTPQRVDVDRLNQLASEAIAAEDDWYSYDRLTCNPPRVFDSAAAMFINHASPQVIAALLQQVAAQAAEIERLRVMLPDVPKRERECKTLDDWRMRALHLESQWAGCSHQCAVIHGKYESAERAREESETKLAKAQAYLDATFDGGAVYAALTNDATRRTGPENVSDTLDALARVAKAAFLAANGGDKP